MKCYSSYCSEVAVHQILIRVIALFKDFSNLTLFLGNSCNFQLIGLKHGKQLDYEVMQSIVFRNYSTPNFVRVIAL